MLQTSDYRSVRHKMMPGDVIAFSSDDTVGHIVYELTQANVTHIGVIRHARIVDDKDAQRYFNEVLLTSSIGLLALRLSDLLSTFHGKVWWLPLGDQLRMSVDFPTLWKAVYDKAPKELEPVPSVTSQQEQRAAGIRSQMAMLVVESLEEAGALENVGLAGVSPMDLCRWKIYTSRYYQLKGPTDPIRGWNSLDPASWAGRAQLGVL